MRQLIALVTSIFLLTACGNSSTTTETKSGVESSTSSSVEDKALTLIHGTHNSTQLEAIEYARKILKENPDFGEVGMLNLNYMDSTIDDGTNVYGVFLVSNRTEETLNQSFEFAVNWSYDGTVIYDKGKILYTPVEYGILTPNSAAIIFLPIPSDKVDFIDTMLDNDKMVLTLSDFSYVE